MQGYHFTKDDLATLLLKRFFPERTDNESTIIRDWLLEHGAEYDRFAFSVRIGQGQTPGVDLPREVATSVLYSTKRRIDILAFQGPSPTIIEVKQRLVPGAMGQLMTYRHLFLEEHPDAPEPRLVAICRQADAETIRVFNAHGVDVFVYPDGAPASAP